MFRTVHISHFIIPLLRHFTILEQKNAQNMPRYYTVEQGKDMDWKRGNGMAEQNFIFWWNNKSLIRWFNIQLFQLTLSD